MCLTLCALWASCASCASMRARRRQVPARVPAGRAARHRRGQMRAGEAADRLRGHRRDAGAGAAACHPALGDAPQMGEARGRLRGAGRVRPLVRPRVEYRHADAAASGDGDPRAHREQCVGGGRGGSYQLHRGGWADQRAGRGVGDHSRPAAAAPQTTAAPQRLHHRPRPPRSGSTTDHGRPAAAAPLAAARGAAWLS